jgi:predicted Rossmann fold flavoprotein
VTQSGTGNGDPGGRDGTPIRRVAVVGGGAAGFFAAIAAAEAGARVAIYESGQKFLTKVLISGGGRCNVTHHCFEPKEFCTRYPRGGRALIGAFHRFQAKDTVNWFLARGVELKVEADGRMFPVTDSSETIAGCLMDAARSAGVGLHTGRGVSGINALSAGGFRLSFVGGSTEEVDVVCFATGGCRSAGIQNLITSLGHSLIEPVPSLFTFQVDAEWLKALPGVSVPDAEISVPGSGLSEHGPLLITHTGLSGPCVLRLSAWGARILHAANYHFSLRVRWQAGLNEESALHEIHSQRENHPAKLVTKNPAVPLPARLWQQLALLAGVPEGMRWSSLPKPAARTLARALACTELPVTGKSLNKEEFVTCGGVPLREVEFKSMQSRVRPGLFFAGEVLDIDGITGGFNFQSAWTTGWIAGKSMAAS